MRNFYGNVLILTAVLIGLCHGSIMMTHNIYDPTNMLTYCCNIGSYLTDCSDDGIDSTMVNPPTGLCRSTIKHCCNLKNKLKFDYKCDPQNPDHMTCCAVCKIDKTSDMTDIIKSLVKKCCSNVAQPLRRACKLGNMWNKTTGKCEDIDECLLENNGCFESQDCVNTVGSYYCVPRETCRADYRFNEELIECQSDKADGLIYTVFNDTDVGQSVEEEEGDLREGKDSTLDQPAKCSLGYRYDSATESCVDVDECQYKPCAHFCKNLNGTYKCECRKGFQSIGNDCEDINECERNPCSHECVNVVGSFRCQCPAGLVLEVDRKNCVEKNINVTCPEQYKVHKTPEDRNLLKCVRLPCETNKTTCKTMPKYITYKSLTIPRNFKISPRGFQIFNLKTKSLKVEVDHKIKVVVEHKTSGIRAASMKDFSTKKEPNRLLVMLMKPLKGPQTFKVILKLVKDKMKVMESVEIRINVK